MAVVFDSTTDALSRTTTLPTITSYSLLAWVFVTSIVSYNTIFCFGQDSSGNYQSLLVNIGDDNFALYNPTTGQVPGANGTFAINTWYHVALTCAGTGASQVLSYRNGVTDITVNGSTTPTNARLWLGNNPDSDGSSGLTMAAVKMYSAVLTAAEIQQEMRCYLPVRTAALNAWSPLLASTDVGNYGGTGAWTVGGTLATANGPPIAWSLRPSMPRRAAAAVAPPAGARQTAWMIGQAVPRASVF